MKILFLAVTNYKDPFVVDWHVDLRYTVSFLRKNGVEVELLHRFLFDDDEATFVHLTRKKPEYIFVHLSEENEPELFNILYRLRKEFPEIVIIAGGILATFAGAELLSDHPEIDWLIAGERELCLLEISNRVSKGESLNDVPGLITRDFRNVPGLLISDLDGLGEMVYEGLDEMMARMPDDKKIGYLLSGRGCYARCSFCSVPGYYQPKGLSWRCRSVSAVIDEIQHLSERYSINYFMFRDDNFFGPGKRGKERAKSIANEIIARNLKISYFICCRINDIEWETFKLLKESGLERVGIGVESTQGESLQLFNKGVKVEQIYPALEILDKLELKTEINMIFFDPYLNMDGVRGNLAFIQYIYEKDRLSYTSAYPFNELKPFPWSPVANRLKSENLLNKIDYTCRYRDPDVWEVVKFARRLRSKLPPIFKELLLSKDLVQKIADADTGIKDELQRIIFALRYWIGLCLMPRYLSKACDIIEKTDRSGYQSLDELENDFCREIEPFAKDNGMI
jgi:radical SAM superfamily enzyme YgiQ (UPF0313 family)